MKKFLSIILSFTLLMSISITAFAENQVVTVSIPDLDYTMTIPANCTIEYKNTDAQIIGDVTFTSTDWQVFKDSGMAAHCRVSSNGQLTNDNGHIINYEYGLYDSRFEQIMESVKSITVQGNSSSAIAIKVSDWSGAKPGTTYTTTITYTASIVDER